MINSLRNQYHLSFVQVSRSSIGIDVLARVIFTMTKSENIFRVNDMVRACMSRDDVVNDRISFDDIS